MIITAVAVLLLALLASWAIPLVKESLRERPVSRPFEEQWAEVQQRVPDGQLFVLEWREGRPENSFSDKVFYLDVFWFIDDSLQFHTNEAWRSHVNGPSNYSATGYRNHSVPEQVIEDLKQLSDSLTCIGGEGRFTRVVMLPDGTPMLAAGCAGSIDATKMADAQRVILDGQQFMLQNTASQIIALDAMLRHTEFKISKLTMRAKGYFVADACMDLTNCRFSMPLSSVFTWPSFNEYPAIAPADPFTWPDRVRDRIPAGIPAGYFNSDAPFDQQKLEERIKQIGQSGIFNGDPGVFRSASFVRNGPDSFMMIIYDFRTDDIFFLDQDGNRISP